MAATIDPIPLTEGETAVALTSRTMYHREVDEKLDIRDVTERTLEWNAESSDSFNFGFTGHAYWFRFSIKNDTDHPEDWLFEINSPLLDSIKLYCPKAEGGFNLKQTGDLLPFSHRDVQDRNFMFHVTTPPGTHTYFLRIESTSSLNFSFLMWSPRGDRYRLITEFPVHWIYYGLMMIMAVYNLFIFFSSKESSYLYYVLFISAWILFQLTLNGFAYQYLWPNLIWWANNSLPLFISLLILLSGLFMRSYLGTASHFKTIDRTAIGLILVPGIISIAVSLAADYRIAIKIATALSLVVALTHFVISLILVLRNHRPARFYLFGFFWCIVGIMTYASKSFGLLPCTFITNWSVQIGSALMVLLFSVGLADRISTLRTDIQKLYHDQVENERVTAERARFLETVVEAANILTEEFVRASRDLNEISDTLGMLSQEQASTSEEFSATFEELTSSTEHIHTSTLNQKDEGEKSKVLVQNLDEAQKTMIQESLRVADDILEISNSANSTEESLRLMDDRMNTINAGGKEIDQFIAMIDEISDRINLLSLNAAIEAARAGEYGRGFAVVADEIGKLAQATSDNSKRIADKIGKIIRDIDNGTELVSKTRQSTDIIFTMVTTIRTRIESVKSLMEGHTNAVRSVVQQAGVIDTLSKDVVTSTNEQMTSMNQSLKTIERLSEMALEVNQANEKIRELTRLIARKTIELSGVVNASSLDELA